MRMKTRGSKHEDLKILWIEDSVTIKTIMNTHINKLKQSATLHHLTIFDIVG